MATLHLFGGSGKSAAAITGCLDRAGDGDAVLLIGDGVHAAAQDTEAAAVIRRHGARCAVFVLGPDCEARGLRTWAAEITTVDHAGFVALTTAYHPVVSWN